MKQCAIWVSYLFINTFYLFFGILFINIILGLTAVCSSEVLDVMCSDFPDQYEEYRKHMREKQVKEHSKKQKEFA